MIGVSVVPLEFKVGNWRVDRLSRPKLGMSENTSDRNVLETVGKREHFLTLLSSLNSIAQLLLKQFKDSKHPSFTLLQYCTQPQSPVPGMVYSDFLLTWSR